MTSRKAIIHDFGQLFILAFDGPKLTDELVEFFHTFRIGGIILFSDNCESPEKLSKLIAEIQARCATDEGPLFIATDHEGGKTQQFRDGFIKIPPMATVGQGTREATIELHRRIGRELGTVGVNLNFAPVADLCGSETAGCIGDRSFGMEAERVSRHVTGAIEGLQSQGVLACVKHFPGHGATVKSSHEELPFIELEWNALKQHDLIPFAAAIEGGISAVMTAHIVYPNAGDAKWPASLSPYCHQEVLRRQLGFEGVIITDSLEMKALTNTWSPVECGRQAFKAGADILIYYKEKNQFETFYKMREALERGELDSDGIAIKLKRVRQLKGKISKC